MSVSDTDLELLESYLDGELTAVENEALRRRLATEPLLVSAVETLRGERAVRAAFWQACEPGDDAVSRLMGRVEKKVDDHWMWTQRLRKLRFASAAAACILAGWIGRGMIQTPHQATQAPLTAVAVNKPEEVKGPVELPITDEYGRLVAVQHFDTPEQAKEFMANDFQAWQDKQQQGGAVVPVSAPEKF